MRIARVFVDRPLTAGETVTVDKATYHYLFNVLRLRSGASLRVFNGQGGEYSAQLLNLSKKTAQLQIEAFQATERESALTLTLIQAVCRPEHMDYALQKAVELGVQQIIPLRTERSPPLDQNRLAKRHQHWQQVIIQACEQCGRNRLPQLHALLSFAAGLAQTQQHQLKFMLAPQGQQRLSDFSAQRVPSIAVLIGAEGGLTEEEMQLAQQLGYNDIHLGPRVLRTETASVAMLAICQALWGDVGLLF
ncbi:MAG: 16S rRNA (uracil(1498)-N(3))-methyltransferase [Pseudomonadota bacterium]|nr:16S rRNA (uracil(1498)-N(3))-methyltransferase [Pseudomonadota bacterium]